LGYPNTAVEQPPWVGQTKGVRGMIDGFSTNSLPFSSVLAYLYGLDESLRKIDTRDRLIKFEWAIPSEDAKILINQFDLDELTVQARSFTKAYGQLTQLLRDIRHSGNPVWLAPASRDEYFADARAKLKVKQDARGGIPGISGTCKSKRQHGGDRP